MFVIRSYSVAPGNMAISGPHLLQQWNNSQVDSPVDFSTGQFQDARLERKKKEGTILLWRAHVNKTVMAYTNSRVPIQYLDFFTVMG